MPHDYLEPLEALSDERPVIFYDQLGCGNSDIPEDIALWTVERFVDEFGVVISSLGLKEVHILGQSWGTMLAVDYLLARGSQGIRSLILSGPCISSRRFISDQREYLLLLPEDLQRTIQECEAKGSFSSQAYQDAMMAYYRLHVCRLDPWPDCMNRAMSKLGHGVYEQMWGQSEFTMTGTLFDYDRSDRLSEINVPVLFTCGRHDVCTPSSTAYYRSRLPGSEMIIFEDASHEHHLERTADYLRVVRDFLTRAEEKRC